ncbi:MAG: ATP synthase subunit I [Clostridium tyrobutyricum]|jgi:ATP synthase protein I|uniref:ATP synthase subunit I n=1 Tax=Clostridium tyrobutyricum TaxID=1519 RepID=UPI0011C9B33F|nr:ATP synthase subunit I [Clostridium tyrobutyricum]MBV4416264.1 ATP synthase subunit I [Clostridium tyrobutyricum]MBV4441623.1 ATP synthase subunit I [Clostridium tyrobutyricum]MBV4445787.1 ATP synthase subunit I [Clostridium tyrobutyricum]MCH4199148.1 ATP synthase subunit I [Clostridium tyrobutyricum]MCH4258453.1 ATP synthase subunit I [Clostridium tyrobutyricum]
MDKDIIYMIKKVSIINIIFGIILSIIGQLIFKSYGLFIMVGVLIAVLNFFINSALGGLAFEKFKNSSASLYIIGFIIRIIIAAVVGYLIFNYDKYSTIAYLVGYTSNLLGIYIYSVIRNNQ